MLSYYCVVMT